MRSEGQQIAQLGVLLGQKYEVLRRIGGGGMAQVFLARHRFHGGLFAVKVLAEYLARDPQIVARFEQEARTSASLSGHPNIVPIFDIGHGEGLHYLIMQYISGEDMATYLRRQNKLTPAEAANVVAQTAEALAWSESKRVVHRDLKPANMLLDTTGRIVVLDFGISKIADIADGLTRPGESLGTPYYMSPEQIRGESCDVRSDLYSLGVVFFELLTGRKPFDNESSTAIQMAHLSQPAPAPATFNPDLPPVCDALVMKLMQKRREDRFQSPQALLEELHAQGAVSGPGLLRPHLNAELEAILSQQIPTLHLEASGSVPAVTLGAVPEPASQLTPVDQGMDARESLEGRLISEDRGGGKRKYIWIGAAALAAVAGALLAFLLNPVPAFTVEDSHGTMMLVPSGDFIFGDNSPYAPRPRQIRTTKAFYIDRTEVSNAEFKRFVDATGHASPQSANFLTAPELPVSGVSFDDAQAYATWVHKRLPSEEEWEKAARGTDGRVYPWGNDAWTVNVPTVLQPVDSFGNRKSPYGVLNMAGNVFEWTTAPFPAGEREFADMRSTLGNDEFSKTWYSIKGGSFSPHDDIFFACFLRRGFPSDQHAPVIGFRCVRDLRKSDFKTRFESLFSKR